MIYYQLLNKERLILDKWIVIHTITGVASLIGFILCTSLSAEDILNVEFKRRIDLILTFVIPITWLRFFSLFLLLEKFSIIVMTML